MGGRLPACHTEAFARRGRVGQGRERDWMWRRGGVVVVVVVVVGVGLRL